MAIKTAKASTSTRAALPTSSTSSAQSSQPSTTSSSPKSTTSGLWPRFKSISKNQSQTTTPSPPSWPVPSSTPAPQPGISPSNPFRLQRPRPDCNYRELHLGRKLFKRCSSTGKSVGKAVWQTITKVQKLVGEFPVISRHSSSSSTASSKRAGGPKFRIWTWNSSTHRILILLNQNYSSKTLTNTQPPQTTFTSTYHSTSPPFSTPSKP